MVAPKRIPTGTSSTTKLSSHFCTGVAPARTRSSTTTTSTHICLMIVLLGLIITELIGNPASHSYTESFLILSNSSALLSSSTESRSDVSMGTPHEFETRPMQSSKKVDDHIPMEFLQVLYEKDVAKDFSNQTSFEGTYFDSSPSCTPLTTDQVSFTLVTQASMDRLWIMKHHCERWPSPLPISIAVYLPHDSPHDEIHVTHELGVRLGCELHRMKVTVLRGSPLSTMERYPVNLLRNLAIQTATTSHVIYTDSDFLISDGLQEDLMAMAPTIANNSLAAIVIPAFVYQSACPETSDNTEAIRCLTKEWKETGVPKTKEDLLKMWDKDRSTKPLVKPGFHGIHFHGSTKYRDYRNQTEPLPIPCIKNYLYEPYLAVRLCKQLPKFPEVFRGYGWNKNVWIMWLTRKLNYRLFQIPRGFVVHVPHKKSPSWWSVQKTDPESGKRSTSKPPPEHDRYLTWFKKEVPNHPERLPACPGKK